ncbi:MAG: SapC family protein [Pseudomonadota bacterium]
MTSDQQSPSPQDQQPPRLPPLYGNVVPVNAAQHGALKLAAKPDFSFARTTHILPVLVEEFSLAQRYFPILFAPEGEAYPMVLVGLREGENLFIDDKGEWRRASYVPGYLRRYPFILARRDANSQEFGLCMDDTAKRLNKEAGEPLFAGDQPSDYLKSALEFCRRFEESAQQTRLFCRLLNENNLLRSGEVSLNVNGKPVKYDGFRMIDEKKLAALPDATLATFAKNGALTAIHAHLFSLAAFQNLFADIIARQEAAA